MDQQQGRIDYRERGLKVRHPGGGIAATGISGSPAVGLDSRLLYNAALDAYFCDPGAYFCDCGNSACPDCNPDAEPVRRDQRDGGPGQAG